MITAQIQKFGTERVQAIDVLDNQMTLFDLSLLF